MKKEKKEDKSFFTPKNRLSRINFFTIKSSELLSSTSPAQACDVINTFGCSGENRTKNG